MIAPQVPRGLVAESPHLASQRGRRLAAARDALGLLAQSLHARPQFIAYSVADLPATLPTVARRIFGPPAAHLDRAQRRATPHGRALCRPDDL